MESLEFLENQVNLLDYIQEKTGTKAKQVGMDTYRINPCPICGGQDHFTVYRDTNHYISFTNCCGGGKILKFMQEYEGKNETEAIRELYEITGNAKSSSVQTATNGSNVDGKEFIKEQKLKFNLDGIKNQTDENKKQTYEYLESRGINRIQAEKYHMFISNDVYEDKNINLEGTPRLVIPIYKDGYPTSYVARALTEVPKQYKVLNSAGEQTPLNIDYIKKADSQVKSIIYICEGWADAISLEDVGKKAIALHSVNNVNKFIEAVEAYKETANKNTYVLCFDNDEAGRKATKTAIEKLEKLGVAHYELNVPAPYNDINDWYKAKPQEFRCGIEPFFNENALNYIVTEFDRDVVQNATNCRIKTGFDELDEKLGDGFGTGLVIIGGGSSVGKTSFVLQTCDQIAEKGYADVIYFSLEQGRFELVCKSLSRQTYLEDGWTKAKSGLEIMQNPDTPTVIKKPIERYKRFANNIHIIQGNFDTTVSTITDYVESYINIIGRRPVVVVDYLQILKPVNDRDTDKGRVDSNVKTLKQLSAKHKLLVIAVSSFNRENYNTTVDYRAFKESGAIEYSADIVFGMQLETINHLQGLSENERRDTLNQAKSSEPRQIELVCLKNRNGMPYFKCLFDFYPKYNFFKERQEDSF